MRSIYRSKKHVSLINKLREKDTRTGVAVFPTVKALQCYAAVLGFDRDRRESFDRKETDNIEWHTFQNDGYTQYIFLIALAASDTMNVLEYDIEESFSSPATDDMVKIFEEYAHGGFNILQTWIDKEPGELFGTKAIMNGLLKHGYLNKDSVLDSEFQDPEF